MGRFGYGFFAGFCAGAFCTMMTGLKLLHRIRFPDEYD